MKNRKIERMKKMRRTIVIVETRLLYEFWDWERDSWNLWMVEACCSSRLSRK
jgi:hypothetical protein